MFRSFMKWFGILTLALFVIKNPDAAANLVTSVMDAASGVAAGIGKISAHVGG